ncbi:MAG: lysozyme inhibitor LprI family protein [Polaromonas sp.]
MKRLFSFFAVLTLVCAPLAVSASDAGQSRQYAACMDKSGATTMGMIECMTEENRRQDARLNKAYKALMADLPPARQAQLQQVQRAWIKYRDANCGFYDDPDGGTLARVSANDCMMSATTRRAQELESFRQ